MNTTTDPEIIALASRLADLVRADEEQRGGRYAARTWSDLADEIDANELVAEAAADVLGPWEADQPTLDLFNEATLLAESMLWTVDHPPVDDRPGTVGRIGVPYATQGVTADGRFVTVTCPACGHVSADEDAKVAGRGYAHHYQTSADQ